MYLVKIEKTGIFRAMAGGKANWKPISGDALILSTRKDCRFERYETHGLIVLPMLS